MNYKSFPPEFFTQIEKTILELKAANLPLIAAFDADGTLWDIDLGENFFQYEIDNQLVKLPADPWDHYRELKKVNDDPRDAYVWLAQINTGVNLPLLRQWTAAAFDSIQPKPVFSDQKKLVALLLSHGVEVYIVTASITWAVEPGARAIGVNAVNVIGVETVIKEDTITTEKILPITYRTGKVEALLKRTNNRAPFFCVGNTLGDYELLAVATHHQLAVSAASRDDRLFKSENELQIMATEKNWWRHRFI